MTDTRIEQQRHGYAGGHQLLASSIPLDRADQDVIDRLSDIGGQPGPNEEMPSYLTGYPLPSGRYFAFARTWYDANAPRAGCVVTHTLLVPQMVWSAAKGLSALAALHSWFVRDQAGRSLPSIALPGPEAVSYPPARASGQAELCEALFLEERRPTAWLTEADDKTVLRVIEALWPALRVRFAFQSYALKPRYKAEGLFDLMVAPKSARGRFSGWDGRRIDGDAPPRHSFTPLLVHTVFDSAMPDLKAVDPLGILATDEIGDPTKLRLSILWNQFNQSHDSDPNMALGMLDVLAAASLPASDRWRLAGPLFQRILAAARLAKPPSADLMALTLGKLEPGDAQRIGAEIASLAAEITHAAPAFGIQLATIRWKDPSVTPLLDTAVAEELSRSPSSGVWTALRAAPPETVTQMVVRRPALLLELAGKANDEGADWAWLEQQFAHIDDAAIAGIRHGLLKRLHGHALASLMPRLLSGLPHEELRAALKMIGEDDGFADAAVIEAFAALDEPSHSAKLDALLAADLPEQHARAVLGGVLRFKPKDIDWLLDADMALEPKAALLFDLIGARSEPERRRAGLEDRRRIDQLLTILLPSHVGARLGKELLLSVDDISDTVFDLVIARLSDKAADADIAGRLIQRIMPLEHGRDAERLLALLQTGAGDGWAKRVPGLLFDLLFPERARNEELSYSLALDVAARFPEALRNPIIRNLATLAGRASSHRVYELSGEAYRAWATLVDEAKALKGDVARKAVESALAYTFKRDYSVVLPLVQSSFVPAFNLTLRPDKRSRNKAADMAERVTRLFSRNRWDGVLLIQMFLETTDLDFVLEAAASGWTNRNFIRAAIEAYDARVEQKGSLV